MILSADYVIDVGPGAGDYGGQIVAEGMAGEIEKNSKSLTGKYLTGEEKITPPKKNPQRQRTASCGSWRYRI
jgi:excinuclease ABC subunit A